MSITASQVVVGYDFTEGARPALSQAIALASREPWRVLHFLFVLPPHYRVDYVQAERMHVALSEKVALELHGMPAHINHHIHVRIGRPVKEILLLAREMGADLVILGEGHVAAKVARRAHCSVEVMRPNTYEHVDLLAIQEVEPHHSYVPPHRYHYDDSRASVRPSHWPIS